MSACHRQGWIHVGHLIGTYVQGQERIRINCFNHACLETHLNISTRRTSTDSMRRLELAHRFRSLAEGLAPASQADSSTGCSCEGRKRRSKQPKKSGHKSSCCVGARDGKTVSAAFCTGGKFPASQSGSGRLSALNLKLSACFRACLVIMLPSTRGGNSSTDL